ncbi:MAG TPA: lysophospholipid acyltransferase family protein [Candidatus Acidoferrales bacterium]|jgi:1-acyl-sn-glycerol-3-phosphate acyltransferase|nr:lysophospholipid acyltransferase family protein [Candidatus Acidoferrales bacterium]
MNPWNYEPAADLDQSTIERLRRFPREPDMIVYGLRSIMALGLRSWLKLYHRLEITGSENLPKTGSFIVVANHASHLDTLCLLAAMPLHKLHRAFPAAAQDYFFVSIPRLAVAAVMVNALPFGRQKHIRQSLELCGQLLANPGNILILFPEGTRTATGQIGEFKPGIGLLVAGRDVPVVPCHLQGAFNAWPKGKSWPRPHKLRLQIGRPRTYATYPPGKESSEEIGHDLRCAVCDLAASI